MNKFKTPLIALAMLAAFAAWSIQPATADETPEIPEGAAQYMLQVEGMT